MEEGAVERGVIYMRQIEKIVREIVERPFLSRKLLRNEIILLANERIFPNLIRFLPNEDPLKPSILECKNISLLEFMDVERFLRDRNIPTVKGIRGVKQAIIEILSEYEEARISDPFLIFKIWEKMGALSRNGDKYELITGLAPDIGNSLRIRRFVLKERPDLANVLKREERKMKAYLFHDIMREF